MTSATERIRALLDERGVEWEAFDVFEQTTQWSTHNGAFVYWARERDGKLLVETTAPTKCSASCTPEQAIAVTLGRSNVGRYVGLRRGKYWERTENSDYYCGGCGWKVTDHDSYCPECGGALHNATLGSFNCTNGCTNSERTETCHDKGTFNSWGYFTCSNCSIVIPLDAVKDAPSIGRTLPPKYCPNCGKKIVEPTTNDVGAEVDA